ncbi:ABC transporter ATP-binding protein [Lactiplantibacillus plantarum]|nr:ABC transporter ATP-binding protein [Lactiplantibacillus plantarum]
MSAKGVVDRGDTTYDEYLAHEATQGRVQDLY